MKDNIRRFHYIKCLALLFFLLISTIINAETIPFINSECTMPGGLPVCEKNADNGSGIDQFTVGLIVYGTAPTHVFDQVNKSIPKKSEFSSSLCKITFENSLKYRELYFSKAIPYSLNNFEKSLTNQNTPSYTKIAAAYVLAMIYADIADHGEMTYGIKGMQQDLQRAINYYTYTANRGSADAAFNLGVIYLNQENLSEKNKISYDTPRYTNMAASLYWLEKASYLGSYGAAMTLSDLYKQGIGMPQDPIYAYAWQAVGLALETSYTNKNINDLDSAIKKIFSTHKNFSSIAANSNKNILSELYNDLTPIQRDKAIVLSKKFWGKCQHRNLLDEQLQVINKTISLPYMTFNMMQSMMASCALKK